jgi:UDP-N-acetylmuramate dehydrogenase
VLWTAPCRSLTTLTVPQEQGASDDHAAVRAAAAMLGGIAVRDAPLDRFSGYRVAGRATLLATCKTLSDVERVAAAVRETELNLLVVGRGSNLLIADSGVEGLVVTLAGDFTRWAVDLESGSATANGAAIMPLFVKSCGTQGLHGMEWAVGIPGSVGGALCMNAGCHNRSMEDVVDEAEVVDLRTGDVDRWSTIRCELAFRRSGVESHHIITLVTFGLESADPRDCQRLQDGWLAYRKQHHPGGRNTGSVFVNLDAWQTIKKARADELRVGCARVSPKHANFIVVDGNAKRGADDVFELMCQIREVVRERTGVVLASETRLAGFTRLQLDRLSS